MRTTLDEFTFHVMNAMADDWESLVQIVPQVEHYVGAADRGRVAQVLIGLLTAGFVSEMRHSCLTAERILETPEEFWFAMTPTGRALWNSEAFKFE